MNPTEIRAEITRAAVAVFESEDNSDVAARLTNDQYRLTDLSDSSLKLVEFCMELEENLNISLEFSDLVDNPVIADFATLLHKRA